MTQTLPESNSSESFSTQAIFKNTGRKLITPKELSEPSSGVVSLLTPHERDALTKVSDWLTNSIMMTVTKYNRQEAVCPFAKPAVDSRLIYLSVSHLKNPLDPEEIKKEVRLYADIYDQLPGKRAKDALLRSLMVLMPDTPDHLIAECMPPQKNSVKTELMKRGIMVGEFFPTDYMKATWDRNYRIPPSPVPFYIIRTFIENDWLFINHVTSWRVAFKRYFPKTPKENISMKTKIKRYIQELVHID